MSSSTPATWEKPSPKRRNGCNPRSGAKAEDTSIIFIVTPGLIITTIASTLILAALENDWTFHGETYRRIDSARATTQFIVQMIAQILGAVHVQTIAKLINYATHIHLLKRPMSLDRLKLWHALSMVDLDWSTRLMYLPVVVLFCIAALVPSALWTAALTPVHTSTKGTEAAFIELPQYTKKSYDSWVQNIVNTTDHIVVNPNGTFSYLPLQDRLGYLITDGSAASSVDGRPQQHAKNDNSNFIFIGRSYGVGSSVGLTNDTIQARYGTVSYEYTETGYRSEVECIYNETSEFGLILVTPQENRSPKWSTPGLFLATGPGPNTTRSTECAAGNVTDCGGYIMAGFEGDRDIVAAAWWASAESGLAYMGFPGSPAYLDKTRPVHSKAYTALAAGAGNQNLNKTQCSISMVPDTFSVKVNVSNRTISVTAHNEPNVKDIEASSFIADSASSILGVMSSIDTTLHTSIIGTMLQRNIANINQQHNLTNSTQETTNRGVAESLEALIDDHLLAIASAQLVIAQDSYPVPMTVSSAAFSIGQRAYAIAIVVLNALILLVFIVEALRTRNWATLPQFNYSDIKSVIIASSLGARTVGRAALDESDWVGDSMDRKAGAVKVKLGLGNKVVLDLAGSSTSRKQGCDDGVSEGEGNEGLLPAGAETPAS